MSSLSEREIARLLSEVDDRATHALFARADRMRRDHMGDGILLRGIVEFSSYCRGSCAYCGLNRRNTSLERYRLSVDDILSSVDRIAAAGIRTVVLQSGDDPDMPPGWFAEVISAIKSAHDDMAITLSVGERPPEDYRLWHAAGADRYLLKIETTNPRLYAALHPGMSFDDRIRCLNDLRTCGYQVGCGSLIGLKGQTVEDIAHDIAFFAAHSFDMIGIGPFIPHAATPLGLERPGNVETTLRAVALTRLVVPEAHMPATTALGSIEKQDRRIDALRAGANVLMPNFTPALFKKRYEIYPGKRCLEEASEHCVGCMETLARSLGRYIDYGRGDAPRYPLPASETVRTEERVS